MLTGRRTWDKNMAKIKQLVSALRSETPNLRRKSSTKSQPSSTPRRSTPRRSAGGGSASKRTTRLKLSGVSGDMGEENAEKTKKSSNSALAIVNNVNGSFFQHVQHRHVITLDSFKEKPFCPSLAKAPLIHQSLRTALEQKTTANGEVKKRPRPRMSV